VRKLVVRKVVVRKLVVRKLVVRKVVMHNRSALDHCRSAFKTMPFLRQAPLNLGRGIDGKFTDVNASLTAS